MDDMGNYWPKDSTGKEKASKEVKVNSASSRKSSSRKGANSSPVRKQNRTMDLGDARPIEVTSSNSEQRDDDSTGHVESGNFEEDAVPIDMTMSSRERLERTEKINAQLAQYDFRRHILNELPAKLYVQVVPKEVAFFFSPYSVHSVMSMLLLGLRGVSEKEIKEVLGCNDRIHEENLAVREALMDKIEGMVCTANRIYVRRGRQPLKKFNEDCRKYYGAEAKSMDFIHNPEGCRREINEWVQNHTRDKIKNIIAEGAINQNTRIVMVNAIYFKGKWATEFDRKLTRKRKFHVAESVDIEVDMIDQEGWFTWWNDVDFPGRMIELDYQGETVSMVLLLPWRTFGLEELEKAFKPSFLRNLRRSSEMRVIVPKFKIEGSSAMVEAFKNLGVHSIFGENADLSGICGTKDIHVTSIFHKAFIEVNEEGTEAAAVDTMTFADCGVETVTNRFYCNHPFMFVIRHKPTNTILFMGSYTGVDN